MGCRRSSPRSFVVCASVAISLFVAITRYNLPWFENDITVQSVQLKNPRGVKGKIARREVGAETNGKKGWET